MKPSCILSVLPLSERILFLLACPVNSLPNPHHFTQLYKWLCAEPSWGDCFCWKQFWAGGSVVCWETTDFRSWSSVLQSSESISSCGGGGACCRSVPSRAGSPGFVCGAELSPLWKRWLGRNAATSIPELHSPDSPARAGSWSVQPSASDTAHFVIPSLVKWSQPGGFSLVNHLECPPETPRMKRSLKKWAVWIRKEANTAFGDGSVCRGVSAPMDGWMNGWMASLMHPVGLGDTVQIPVVRREGRWSFLSVSSHPWNDCFNYAIQELSFDMWVWGCSGTHSILAWLYVTLHFSTLCSPFSLSLLDVKSSRVSRGELWVPISTWGVQEVQKVSGVQEWLCLVSAYGSKLHLQLSE